MDPTSQSGQPSTKNQQAAPQTSRSCGSVTTRHIQWVCDLRSERGRWSSEVQGPWTETENAYFEFAYELFCSGLLRGIEVGLPLRFFMSELLGCEVKRVDQKLLGSNRPPEFGCPRLPRRELTTQENTSLTSKLAVLEQAFLARECYPLDQRVVYETADGCRRRGSSRASDARAPLGTAARAAYVDPRTPLSESVAEMAEAAGPPAIPTTIAVGYVHSNGAAAAAAAAGTNGAPALLSEAKLLAEAPAAAAAAAAAIDNRHPRAPGCGSESATSPPVSVARGLLAAALAGPEPPKNTPKNHPVPVINPPFANSTGRELGQQLLGVARPAANVSDGEGPPRQRQKTSPGPSAAASAASAAGIAATAAAVPSFADTRSNGATWEGEVQETAADLEAMEYLKWELHGKFMAFPGEHYHELLANLASEIYHNRYPVEHGVDVLHGVMQEAGPEALKKCAATLKRMNLPPKMSL